MTAVLCHTPWLTAKYTVAKCGTQNSESCRPNRPGHRERPDCDGWWMLVVCCCGCKQPGHLVLLLAIVKESYWSLTLPLCLRSMRFDDVVMATKWLFKEVKWEHPAMFSHLINSHFYGEPLLQIKVIETWENGLNKRRQFIARVGFGYSYNRTSQNPHHCRDNSSTSKHVFFKTRRLFVASPM